MAKLDWTVADSEPRRVATVGTTAALAAEWEVAAEPADLMASVGNSVADWSLVRSSTWLKVRIPDVALLQGTQISRSEW